MAWAAESGSSLIASAKIVEVIGRDSPDILVMRVTFGPLRSTVLGGIRKGRTWPEAPEIDKGNQLIVTWVHPDDLLLCQHRQY